MFYHCEVYMNVSKDSRTVGQALRTRKDQDPNSSTTDGIIEQVNAMIQTKRRVTTDEVAHHLQISHDFAYEITHERLGFLKVCARWVPKQLTEKQAQAQSCCLLYTSRCV